MRLHVRIGIGTAMVWAMAGSASAGFTVYTDRAAFEVAAVAGGDTLTHENFDAVTADQSFQMADGSKTVGPLTFSETGSTAGSSNGNPNRVDATAFETSGIFSGDGTTYVYLAVNADDNNPGSAYGVDLDFAVPVSAFGGDFTSFIGSTLGEAFRLTLLNATTAGSFLLPTPASSGTHFFGIVADPGDTFAGIAFAADMSLPSRRGTQGLDNISVVLVPEPAAGALALLGSLSLIRRRRK